MGRSESKIELHTITVANLRYWIVRIRCLDASRARRRRDKGCGIGAQVVEAAIRRSAIVMRFWRLCCAGGLCVLRCFVTVLWISYCAVVRYCAVL